MAELALEIPGKIFFGSDVLNLAGSLTASYGTRAILISEQALHAGRHIEQLRSILRGRGIECIVVDDTDFPGKEKFAGGVMEMAKASRIQVILGMGGLRTLSRARETACLLGSNPAKNTKEQALPYIEIPSVFRQPLLLRDAYLDENLSGRGPQILDSPKGLVKAALIDPGLTASLPIRYVGTLFLDSILQAFEGYLAGDGNFLSQTLFFRALELLGEGINDTFRGVLDLRPRVMASQAGVLSALGFTSSTAGAGTALCYAIAALFKTPRSWVATVLLPHIMELHLDTKMEKLVDTAKALGEDVFGLPSPLAAKRAPARIRRIIAHLGLPGRLRDLDLELSELVDAAEAASRFDTQDGLPLTLDSLYDILKRAY